MEIKRIETIKEMVHIVAELVFQGITFIVTKHENGMWYIELIGGY